MLAVGGLYLKYEFEKTCEFFYTFYLENTSTLLTLFCVFFAQKRGTGLSSHGGVFEHQTKKQKCTHASNAEPTPQRTRRPFLCVSKRSKADLPPLSLPSTYGELHVGGTQRRYGYAILPREDIEKIPIISKGTLPSLFFHRCFFKCSNPCDHTHENTCAHAIPLPTYDIGKGDGRWLSPFNLPVTKADVNDELRSEEKVSENIENYWQGGKVYERIVTHTVTNSKDGKKYTRWHQNKEEHARMNEQGEWVVNAQWEAWRTRLLAHPYAVRRPNGSVKKGGVPLFSMHEGKQLDYVSSRKAVYLPVYTSAVRRHPFYQEILAKLRSGKSIMLIDVDGPDRVAYPNGLEMSPERLVGALHDIKRPFGHGYACAWALMEDAQL
jgi:hypothetical protein